MSDLVRKLCDGNHRVELSLRPERSVQALMDSVERGYVLIRFPDTRGGTELGITLDRERSRIAEADWQGCTGDVCIVGLLQLDYIKVRCVATIELSSLKGTGYLERISDDSQ